MYGMWGDKTKFDHCGDTITQVGIQKFSMIKICMDEKNPISIYTLKASLKA